MKHLDTILAFQQLLKDFNGVYRDLGSIHKTGESDNDVEHSYRVAMLSWMIAEEYELKLDFNKIIKYALIHDLAEVYAGDVSIYADYDQKDKERKEHESYLRLKKNFPKQKEMWELLAAYERREDDESKFVYVIEKLEPILVVLLTEHDHWIKRNVSLDDFLKRKRGKIASIESFAQNFTEEILAYVEAHKAELFQK